MRFVTTVAILVVTVTVSAAQSRPANQTFCTLQPSPVSTLTVVVQDQGNAPIAGAWVRVQHWHFPTSTTHELVMDVEGITDSNGEFSVKLPGPGAYHVFASAPSFTPDSAACQAHRGYAMREVLKLSIFAGFGLPPEGD